MYKSPNIYQCTIRVVDGRKRFFVAFSDINGIAYEVEISQDVYDAFQDFKRSEKRQQNHFERHMEFFELTDEHLYSRSKSKAEVTEDAAIKRIYSCVLNDALNQLSASQRRRFILYYEYNWPYQKIASVENCSIMSISRSIKRAKENLFRILQKYFKEI